MLPFFYLALLVLFGALIAVALTQFVLGAKALGDELEQVQQRLRRQAERQRALRDEFDAIALDLQLLQQEKDALRNQLACMRKIARLHGGGGEGEDDESA